MDAYNQLIASCKYYTLQQKLKKEISELCKEITIQHNLFVTLKEYDTENITLPYKKYDEQMKDDDSVESLKNNESVVKNYLSELDTVIKHLMQNFDNCDIKKIVNYTKIYPSEMNDYNIEMNDINELNELKNESNITDDNSISNMYD